MKKYLLCFAFVANIVATGAFYLPGVAPKEYKTDEPVEMFVNKITSTKTQLPYSYYSLPVCAPEDPTPEGENLGEILSGDRIEQSLYQVRLTPETYAFHLHPAGNARNSFP